MSEYPSLYEKYLTELNQQGNIVQFSPQENMRILQELGAGMDEFINDQKMKATHSASDLATVLLNK